MISFYDDYDRTFVFGAYVNSEVSNKIMDELILQCGCVEVTRANEAVASSSSNYSACTWNSLLIRIYQNSSTIGHMNIVVFRYSGGSFSTSFNVFFDYPKLYLKFRFMKCTTGFVMMINTTTDVNQYTPVLIGINCLQLSTGNTVYALYMDSSSHYITVSASAYAESLERFDANGRSYPTANKQILDIGVIYQYISTTYYTTYVLTNAYCGASLYNNQVIYDGTDYYFSMRLVSIKLTPVTIEA